MCPTGVIVGCAEGWTVADELGRAGAYAVVTPRYRRDKSEELVRPGGSSIENAALLHRAGVQPDGFELALAMEEDQPPADDFDAIPVALLRLATDGRICRANAGHVLAENAHGVEAFIVAFHVLFL